MGIKEGALALADELEAFEDGDCEECIAYGQPECKGHLSCAEIIARYSARKVREAVESDAEDVTTVSAYDLLSEEDREAIAWVRERGGLEAVKASIHQGAMGRRYLLKVAEMLGTSIYDGISNADALLDKLEKRLMPAGCEWPRFEDGEPVRVGDKLMTSDGAVRVEELSLTICDTDGGVTCVPFGERVKRPPVLAADGEPLEAGQTVYVIANGKTHHVTEVDAVSKRFRSMEQIDGSHWLDPMCFTHQRPVLDADGVPIINGESVYEIGGDGTRLTVVRTPKSGEYQTIVVKLPDGNETTLDPPRLTHTNPEIDSWERIEKDKDLNPFDYCKKVGHKLWTFDNAEEFKASDLVRRAKKLAGVDND